MDPEGLKETKILLEVVMLALLLMGEAWLPLFKGRSERLRHGSRNIAMGLMNGVITSFLFAGATAFVAEAAEFQGFGLLNWIEIPFWIETAIAFFLFDLWMYLWHRANHRVPFLWRFHRMHHSDPQLDVTTALRFHIGELIFSSLVRFGILYLLGLSLWQLILYETILLPIILFHHSNVALPERVDRLFRILIVTPNMHRVHHSRFQPETDSNYSSIFSFWDRFAKTFRRKENILTLHYGLDVFEAPKWQSFVGLLATPFSPAQKEVFLLMIIPLLIWSYSNSEAEGPGREFELTYHASVKEIPSEATQLRIWIPLAHTDENQNILNRKVLSSYPYQIFKEPAYDNEILYLFLKPPLPAHLDVAVTYHALVQERRGPLKASHLKKEYHLGSTQWMVVDEKIQELSREVTKGKQFPLEQARAIYEYVLSHMQYDKTTPGWGNGDTLRACLVGKGNCTDFHSLFISLARASEIPSRFKIGLPIPETQEGKIPGYHCWAEFYVDGKGWIPVDASEAWKHPEKREYYFGTYDENRLLISTGRDIQLVPKQEGEPLNFFFYPYVELDGKPVSTIETEFQFKEVHTKQEEV